MTKWNKQPYSQQFLQHEERRKQMIIEAARRRKEKQKKIQQQAQITRKQLQSTLTNRKKQKQQEYIKYLRNNMHDKYLNKKRQSQLEKPQIKPTSKWKSPSKQHLQSLALELNQIKQPKNTKKQLLMDQFEKQWKQQQVEIQQLIPSQLMDSLDLDLDTLNRGKQVNKYLKNQSKNQDVTNQIKNLIGYQSVLFSIDQRKHPKIQQPNSQTNPPIQNKIQNQGQTFNMLKNKKEAKILNWAKEQVQQADELFSNCSSKKNQLLKEINQQLKKQRHKKITGNLQPIIEKVKKSNQNKSKDNEKNSKNINKKSQQKLYQRENNLSAEKKKTILPSIYQNKQQQRISTRIPNLPTNPNKNNKQQRSKSIQQKIKKIPQKAKTDSFTKKATKLQPQYSVATHQQNLEVDSFIKNDLININDQQRKIQQQIRQLHIQNKERIKQVQNKYSIKTNYKSSKQLIQQNSYNHQYPINHANPTCEYDIEQSIQRLDNLLIRRQINSRQKIVQKQQQQFSSLKSIINPLSNPKDLHNQVLKLAENISRYQNLTKNVQKEPQVGGYGYRKNQNINKNTKGYNNHITQQVLSESKNIPQSELTQLAKPPQFQYIRKQQQQQVSNIQQKPQRIQVNPKLKNILFDD